MPKLKNPSVKQKIAMLDVRWGRWVRSYSCCEAQSFFGVCGSDLSWSHIISRTYLKTRFDPRNTQCICLSEHGILDKNPLWFSRFVENSSCGIFEDVMRKQAYSVVKPDYDLWFEIYKIVSEREYSLDDARAWLGQNVLLSIADLDKLI